MTQNPPARSPDLACESVFRGIVEDCAAGIDAALAVFLDSDDPAGPHKARVALRRLTTCLEAFAPMLRRKPSEAMRKAAKSVFRRLGQVRDSDVHLASREGQPGAEKRQRRNARLRDKTRRRLRKAGAVALAPRLVVLVQPGGEIYRRGAAAQALRAGEVRAYAAQVLQAAWQDCLDFGPSVTAIPQRRRHDFRKDMKRLRYLAEFFADQFPALDRDPFRRSFRRIQDALGVLNDYAVALALDGRRMPDVLPPEQAAALAEAEALWHDLAAGPVPWSDPAAQPAAHRDA